MHGVGERWRCSQDESQEIPSYSPSGCMRITKYLEKLQKQFLKPRLTIDPTNVNQNHQNIFSLLFQFHTNIRLPETYFPGGDHIHVVFPVRV